MKRNDSIQYQNLDEIEFYLNSTPQCDIDIVGVLLGLVNAIKSK